MDFNYNPAMKNKRLTPINIASYIITLLVVVVILLLPTDAKSIWQKLGIIFGFGFTTLFVSSIFLDIGVRLDTRLMKIQDKSRRILSSLGVYIGVPFLCVVFPYLIYLFEGSPLFQYEPWKPLPALSDRPVEISAVGEYSIVVLSESGQYYICEAIGAHSCWRDTFERNSNIIEGGDPVITTTPPTKKPPKESVSMVGVLFHDKGIPVRRYYAILEDGSIWQREERDGSFDAGFGLGFFYMLGIIPGTGALLTVYLGAGISVATRRKIKSDADVNNEPVF